MTFGISSLPSLLAALLPAIAGPAAAAESPVWENEQIVQINREPARATFVPFATVEQARAGVREPSPSRHGEIVQQGTMDPLDLAPGLAREVVVPVAADLPLNSRSEYWLRIGSSLGEETAWATAVAGSAC